MSQERVAAWPRPSSAVRGWPIVLWATVAVCTVCSFMFTLAGGGAEGWRAVVRTSAKTSLVFFLAAFVASAARAFWRGPLTKWLLANRRYVGVSFAASHGVHLLAIVMVARLDPAFVLTTTTLIFGGFAYVLIAAMVATSFDASAAWLGRRRWQALHTTGMYYLWAIFALSYVPRMLIESAWYAVFVVPMLAALALRAAAHRRAAKTAV